MRLILLRPRNRLSASPRLERSVLSFFFSFNQTAPYTRIRGAGRRISRVYDVFFQSEALGNYLLRKEQLEECRVVSPLSLQVVLSFLAAGSRGWTRRQIVNFFNADSVDHLNSLASQLCDVTLADGDPAVGPRVRCSNALWLDQSLTLKPSFKQILDSSYRADVNLVDFQTQAAHVGQQINSWVENETSGQVKDLIREGSLNNSVKLVFTNAQHFRGAWDEKNTMIRRDKVGKKEYVVSAQFMAVKMKQFARHFHEIHDILHTYKKQSKEKRTFSFQFHSPVALTSEHYGEDLMDVNDSTTPKFNISSEVEASKMLRELGIRLPFSGGKLTEMVTCSCDGGGENQLYVFNIFHKAFIQVNEQGTEAATATAAILMSGCPPYLPRLRRRFTPIQPWLLAGQTDGDGPCPGIAKTNLKVHQIFRRLPKQRRG
ncbi:serpin-ZX-like [Neltuma alba]|uniref:serpin-ZX-like n=1 Tax=Neltuma alba TaxID=207710 RepID=UPI0010A57C90|nr:serpin-ZX-like [Prosopis alba]